MPGSATHFNGGLIKRCILPAAAQKWPRAALNFQRDLAAAPAIFQPLPTALPPLSVTNQAALPVNYEVRGDSEQEQLPPLAERGLIMMDRLINGQMEGRMDEWMDGIRSRWDHGKGIALPGHQRDFLVGLA